MHLPGPRTTAALGFLLSIVTAIVTNLITNRFTPSLAAFLTALVIAGLLLAVRTAGARQAGGTRLRQTASRGGVIRDSPTNVRQGADVTDTATSRGRIDRSGLTAHGGRIKRKVSKRGHIIDSPTDLS